ncbi:MAG TPA: DUF4388 domain-containing protein [Polyangia bacterium]|jgi:DNA-binding response OmpR family regulator
MAGENLLVVDDNPTILKVVESALARAGYQVDTALDVTSGMELARAKRPAVILIDSLIPTAAGDDREGGLGLCGALADDLELSQTPVVLMTSKTEDHEARYARTPNVIDYITKPFSSDAVLAVVTHVIEKTGAETSQTTRVLRPVAAESTAVAEALSRSTGPARPNPLDKLTEILGERLERYRQESASWEIPAIVRGALRDGGLAALLAEAGYEATETGSGGPDLSGQLGAISMSEVLMLLSQQGQMGTLRVLSDKARVDLFFRKGAIDLAAAVGVAEEFLLGRFAVEAGDITPAALAEVLDARAKAVGKPPLFGRDLIMRGLLTEAQLKQAMRRQTAELTYETLRWAHGTFHFRRTQALPDIVEEAALGIHVDTLLLEGFRRVDEWRLIERDIRNFDLVFVRDEERIGRLPRGTLTRDEISVLDAMSGKSTVRDVIRTLRLGSFDVSKILYRLLHTKLIRPRVEPSVAP